MGLKARLRVCDFTPYSLQTCHGNCVKPGWQFWACMWLTLAPCELSAPRASEAIPECHAAHTAAGLTQLRGDQLSEEIRALLNRREAQLQMRMVSFGASFLSRQSRPPWGQGWSLGLAVWLALDPAGRWP